MTKDENAFGRRVWKGDRRTIAEARDNYTAQLETDPKNADPIPYASTLYSFKASRSVADELTDLQETLIKEGNRIRFEQTIYNDEQLADKANTLSTIFEWMSRYPSVPESYRDSLYGQAFSVCIFGLQKAKQLPKEHHSWPLSALTYTSLLIRSGERKRAREFIDQTEQRVAHIAHLEQRARVYRGLGILNRKLGSRARGFSQGIQACLVPGIPLKVRMKGVAGLIGFR